MNAHPMNATRPEIPHMRGMNFGFAARRGWYGSEEALAQIPRMKALEIDWVAIHVTFVQETYASPRVFMDYEFTPDDREVLTWVKAARAAGLKVMLKPILEPLDGVWRGAVNPPRDEMSTFAQLVPSSNYRSRYCASFEACLRHYTKLAAEAEVEYLCLGAEYYKLEAAERLLNQMWGRIIGYAREIYPGLLTYEFTPATIKEKPVYPRAGAWWKDLDFLGFSCYGDCMENDPTVEQFVAGFAGRLAEARSIHDELGLPLALLETGLRSVSGMKGNAADFAQPGAFDGEIQGRYMEAIVQAFEGEPWYRGFFWWKWDEHQGHNRPHYFTDPAGDQGFTVDGKPSAEALRKIFSDLKAKHG